MLVQSSQNVFERALSIIQTIIDIFFLYLPLMDVESSIFH